MIDLKLDWTHRVALFKGPNSLVVSHHHSELSNKEDAQTGRDYVNQ